MPRNEPQPGFRITQITAFTTIGPDDEEGVIAVPMGDTMMPLIAADITRLTQMRVWAHDVSKVMGVEVTERTFIAIDTLDKLRQEAEMVREMANDEQYAGGQDLAEMVLKLLGLATSP